MKPKVSQVLEKRIVTIGGGTGGFIINRGLNRYPVSPTAICTVFDSGGSTGKLRDEFGSLPQGDIRRCILALANDEDNTLRDIFNHRFGKNGSGLSQHSVGNVLLLAAEQLYGPIEGIRRVSKLLGTHGLVLPVSVDHSQLVAELSDGSTIEGEGVIDTRGYSDARTIVRVSLTPQAFICREAAEALKSADLIIIGPGDLYTSLVPNFLVTGISEAIASSGAQVIYVANIMTKYAETNAFSVADFIEILYSYGVGRDQLDTIIINSAEIPESLLEFYKETEKAAPVLYNDAIEKRVQARTKRIVHADILSETGLQQQLIRHDSAKLARCILSL